MSHTRSVLGEHQRPWVDPPNHTVGPGPLSPAWPKPPAPRSPPRNVWDGLATELLDLQRALLASLANPHLTAPLMLSLDERAELEEKLARIKAGNAKLYVRSRSSEVADWPTPVLPTTVLFGARDIADVLGTAIFVAHTLASDSEKWHPDDEATEPLAAPPETPAPAVEPVTSDEDAGEKAMRPMVEWHEVASRSGPSINLADDEGFFEIDDPVTSTRLVALYEAADPALTALIAIIAPHAARHPESLAPAGIVAETRTLLFDVRKIVSREPVFRGRLDLAPAPDWASLAAKLAFARAALNRFHARYHELDPKTLTSYWRTPGAAAFIASLDE